MSSNLKARIERLEQRQLRKPFSRRVIFSIAEYSDRDVVGMHDGSGKVYVPRIAGEPLEAFERRSAEILPRFAFRAYKAASSASDSESGAFALNHL